MEWFMGGLLLIGALFGGSQAADNASLRYQLEQVRQQAQQQLAAKDSEIAELKQRLEEIPFLRSEIASLRAEAAEIAQERGDSKAALQLLRDALAQARETNAALVSGNDSLLNAFNKLDREFTQWTVGAQKVIDGLELEKQGWVGRALACVNKHNALVKELRAKNAKIADLESKYAKANLVISERELRIQTLVDDLSKAQTKALTAEQNLAKTRADQQTMRRNTVIGVALLVLVIFVLALWLLRIRRRGSSKS